MNSNIMVEMAANTIILFMEVEEVFASLFMFAQMPIFFLTSAQVSGFDLTGRWDSTDQTVGHHRVMLF